MKKSGLYLLALVIAAIGLGGMIYKWRVLKFPLLPNETATVWTLEARVAFKSTGGPNTVTLRVPSAASGESLGFSVVDENLISRGYAQDFGKDSGRVVEWTVRDSEIKNQVLYYRADIVRSSDAPREPSKAKLAAPLNLDEPTKAALSTIFDRVQKDSADNASFARGLVRAFTGDALSDEARIVLGSRESDLARARLLTHALALRQIPARVAQGLVLSENSGNTDLTPYLQVHDGNDWVTIDMKTADKGFPEDFFLWTKTDKALVEVASDPNATVEFSVTPNLQDAMKTAQRTTDVRDTRLLSYSLLSLPASAQNNFKLLLMVPVGAFIMLLLRNVVGIKTFGTFMPVLIALAFDKTKLLNGVVLFTAVVGMGLLVRFFMEKIRLLLVPRLTAVLILVVMLMAFVSILSNRLGYDVGMNVALFPIVIMAMTIERMCVAWDERGPGYAMRQGFGSLATACLAYAVMSQEHLKHLFFVFPELLLVLFALTLLIGRYSGYRLTELFRFKSLLVQDEVK
jgi:hypothetical protein